MAKEREACGRCSMSVAVDVSSVDRDADERTDRNPYDEDPIEVEEGQLRALTPDGWIAGLSSRLDAVATRLVWGR